jgi:hypothetical protein
MNCLATRWSGTAEGNPGTTVGETSGEEGERNCLLSRSSEGNSGKGEGEGVNCLATRLSGTPEGNPGTEVGEGKICLLSKSEGEGSGPGSSEQRLPKRQVSRCCRGRTERRTDRWQHRARWR